MNALLGSVLVTALLVPSYGPLVVQERWSGPAAAVLQVRPVIEQVDVNRASESELQVVPGIGPAMAKRIVEWRTEHGRFERLDDLLNIRGIGVKTLDKLRPYLTVGDEGSRRPRR